MSLLDLKRITYLLKILTQFQYIGYTLGASFFISLMMLEDDKAGKLSSNYNPVSLNITKTTTTKENYHFSKQ